MCMTPALVFLTIHRLLDATSLSLAVCLQVRPRDGRHDEEAAHEERAERAHLRQRLERAHQHAQGIYMLGSIISYHIIS